MLSTVWGGPVAGNRVLVTAQQLVEPQLTSNWSGRKAVQRTAAKVLCVDYEANLALLQPDGGQLPRRPQTAGT